MRRVLSIVALALTTACVTPHVGPEVRSTWSTLVISCGERFGGTAPAQRAYSCLLENRGETWLEIKVQSITAAGAASVVHFGAETERVPPASYVRRPLELALEDPARPPGHARVCLHGPAVECIDVPLGYGAAAYSGL